MHALYPFYARTSDIDLTIKKFEEWAEIYCDENNWWRLICAINSKEERRVLTPGGEKILSMSYPIKPTGDIAEYVATRLEPGFKATIDDLKAFAWLCVIYDINLYLMSDKGIMDDDEVFNLYPNIRDELLKRLRNIIIEKYNEVEIPPPKDSVLLASYSLFKLSKIFHLLYTSELPPFASDATPYEYRCHYLYVREGEGKPGETLLIVDIHT